jgi:small subunit ribosomal protein S20
MPHTRSAKKHDRKAEKRRIHNRAVIKSIKTQVKKFLEVLGEPLDKAQAEFNAAAKKLDKAGAKRIIHPNKAARLKSQLARKLNTKSKPATPATTPTTGS